MLLLAAVLPHLAKAQTPVDVYEHKGLYLVQTIVVDGDTIPVVTLRTTTIAEQRKARSQKHQRQYTKLYKNVVKTYPYAHLAGQLVEAYNENLANLPTQAERKAYMERCEEDLKAEFEGDMRRMTISQGRVLIKLIDRQTGQTSYELIRTMRSGFSAFMWQGVAKFFGTNLKDSYAPQSDETDAMIEEIVLLIENGQIPVELRTARTTAAADVLKERSKRLEKRIERERRKAEKKG
jgi:hypothetical protein